MKIKKIPAFASLAVGLILMLGLAGCGSIEEPESEAPDTNVAA